MSDVMLDQQRRASKTLTERIAERRAVGYQDDRLQPWTVQGPRPRKPRKFVYFIQHPDGPIKIGVALNPATRLASLQTAHFAPLALLVTRKGGERQEAAYHARFAEHRLHGEWFAPHEDILAEIARLSHRITERNERG